MHWPTLRPSQRVTLPRAAWRSGPRSVTGCFSEGEIMFSGIGIGRKLERRGNATVLALMVSLLLMVLVTGTMALTIADTESTQDYTRNRASFEASDSGVQHGRAQLNSALSNFHIPASTTIAT